MRRTALVVSLATFALVGCGSDANAPTSDPSDARATHRPALRCPATAHHLRFRSYGALRHRLVPRHPTRLILCRYAGLNDPHHRLGTLLGSRPIDSRVRIRRIVYLFDSLGHQPYGVPIPCPADTGGKIVARFRYRDLPDDLVAQDLSGCKVTTNGPFGRWALTDPGPRLMRLLKRLTR
jgi:hypothetical protein